MSRKQSVIMSPTEKKEAIALAKATVKNAKLVLSDAEKERKELDKNYNSAVKVSDRTLAAAQKDLAQAEAKLAGLVPPKAVPSPIGE